MRLSIPLAAFAVSLGIAGSAHAVTVSDASGDFLATYTGSPDADLDVTSFSVVYDATTQFFTLGAVFAGAIDPAKAGRYIIGVDTGRGALKPFAAIGQPNVTFDQAITVQKNGTGTVGATALAANAITIVGDRFTAVIPLSLLPSTGYNPLAYGWNLWPRGAPAGLAGISDFAPENRVLQIAAPEPGTWMMMLGGFGIAGVALRRRTTRKRALA
jgi:PEP-CTERM motif